MVLLVFMYAILSLYGGNSPMQSSPVLKLLLAMYMFHVESGSSPSVFFPSVKMSSPVTRTLLQKQGWVVQKPGRRMCRSRIVSPSIQSRSIIMGRVLPPGFLNQCSPLPSMVPAPSITTFDNFPHSWQSSPPVCCAAGFIAWQRAPFKKPA